PEHAGGAGPYQKTSHMVVIMTADPNADPTTRFDPSVHYTFRVRKVEGVASLAAVPFGVGDIDCTFDDATPQHVTCNANGVAVRSTVGTSDVGSATDPVRVFAGLRSNPAFADVDAI